MEDPIPITKLRALAAASGYTLLRPVPQLDLERDGESWENDPETYASVVAGNYRRLCEEIDLTNWPALLTRWSLSTIEDVVNYGPDIALTKTQRRRIWEHAKRELDRRRPLPLPYRGRGLLSTTRQQDDPNAR